MEKNGEPVSKLGKAQLKLVWGFTSINLHYIDNQEMSLATH